MREFADAKNYSPRTVQNYAKELQFLFAHYHDISPQHITQDHICRYINFIKKEHGVGRDKCRMTAAACSFFYSHILKSPCVFPKDLYPRKEFKLPDILSVEQIKTLLDADISLKNKAIIGLFYGSGLRLSELRFLKITDIKSDVMKVKVCSGKGAKDRFTILPKYLLNELRNYYKIHRPTVYLFEGQTKGKPMNDRSIQHAIRESMRKAKLEKYNFSAHTLRHSFATHLLDNGTDIHTIKELLGHAKIETTMIYLHLTQKKLDSIVSPFDLLTATK
jgi:integrase/recombinase XerD